MKTDPVPLPIRASCKLSEAVFRRRIVLQDSPHVRPAHFALGLIAAPHNHCSLYGFFRGGFKELPDPLKPFPVEKRTDDDQSSFRLTRQLDEAVFRVIETSPRKSLLRERISIKREGSAGGLRVISTWFESR
jgi:hypothetical protein